MFIADQGSRISIVMDWAGENLREHRTVTQSQKYTEDVARYMMYQLTSALVYMHSKVGCTLPDSCGCWVQLP
jgi:serine/threonine protein kinase